MLPDLFAGGVKKIRICKKRMMGEVKPERKKLSIDREDERENVA